VRVVLGFIVGLLLVSVAHAQIEVAGINSTETPKGEDGTAPQPTTRIYKYTSKDGVISFSDRAPMRTKYEVVTYSCYACNPRSKVDWYTTKLHLESFDYPIRRAASKYAVDPALVRAVIHAESAFKPDALSRKGAVGLMQLMPATAKDMGVEDSMVPTQNIHGGVKYLAWLLDQHNGNVTLATAAYNAGPGAVRRHQGIPPYAETQTYVRRVKILHERYRKEMKPQELKTQEVASVGAI
jgi:soluble lytic murein transglycosylase-like protein